MKIYEVQQHLGGSWKKVCLLETKDAAEKYAKSINTKIEVYPVRIIKRRVMTLEDLDDDL